ncbi:MAG TPA: penicillin-binding protein 2 [Chloroflexota bacterium]|nr:penicillin-binding protein 2 [Chloroflexota bacterium]
MKKKTKFLLLRASIILAFTVLAGRLWYVQVVMGSYYKQLGDTSKMRLEPVQALRGIIYDRAGRPLVLNVPSWNAEIVPHGIPASRAGTIYRQLSILLHGKPTAKQIGALVRANEWQPYEPFVVKRDIGAPTAMIIKQLHAQLPGVQADPTAIRQYLNDPQDSLAQVLGYTAPITSGEYAQYKRLYPMESATSNDVIGQQGIEAAMDPYLHGVNGTEEVEVDAGERPIRILSPGRFVPGDSVYLTIDSRLQRQVAADLETGLSQLGLRRGVAIVEQVHTGRILALVSLPSYDNNLFSKGISVSKYTQYLNDSAGPLYDHAIAGEYPPGSIYKIVTAAAALQTGVANAGRVIDDTGLIDLFGQKFFGWVPPPGLGPVNVVTALAKSSDIYFYTVAGGNPNINPNMPSVGADRLAHWARLFGLGQTTGIELPGEMPGLIPSAAWYNHQPIGVYKAAGHPVWSLGDTYNMAIGQGLNLVTPLQMVNVAATIANGGTLYRPQIVDHIAGRVAPRLGVSRRDRVIQPFVPFSVRRNFLSPTTVSLIQQGMHASVDLPNWNGTSYLVSDPRIDAAGKTGTAEAPGGADAWWTGYAPYNNPQIAVIVLAPNADTEGATISAPIAHKIFEDYFHLRPIAVQKPKLPWTSDVYHFLNGSSAG